MSGQPSSASSQPSSTGNSDMFTGTDDSPLQTSPSDVPNPTPKPSTFQAVTSQLGMYTGAISMVSMWANSLKGVATTATWSGITTAVSNAGVVSGVRAGIAAVLRIPGVAYTLGGVSAGLSAISAVQGGLDIYKNGITAGKALNLGMSAFGLATGINMMLGPALFTNPAGWLIAGAVIAGTFAYASINDMIINGPTVKSALIAAATMYAVFFLAGFVGAAALLAFSILWSLFHQPPSEEVAANNLNQQTASLVWTAGPLILVGAGTIAALMGFAPNAKAPVMASLTVPSYYMTQAVQNKLLPYSPPMNAQTPNVIVEPDSGEVVIVSPSDNGHVSLTSYELADNLKFVSSATAPQDSYIPFFLYDGNTAKVNPAAVKGIGTQVDLLKSALSGALTTQESMNAIAIASAANKNNVSLGS